MACSSAYTNLQSQDAGVVYTSSVHFCENEAGGGRAGVPAAVLQVVYLEVWMKVVEIKDSGKYAFQNFLGRIEMGAQCARKSFIEVTQQHALGVSQHPDLREYFGANPSVTLPQASGLTSGTVEYEFQVESVAVQKVREHTLYLENKKMQKLQDSKLSFDNLRRGLPEHWQAFWQDHPKLPNTIA